MSEDLFLWRPHPWHGLPPGPDPPSVISVFVEITPFDPVKYEVDKKSGFLRIDRPQYSSSLPPSVYGFIPRTLSGDRVRDLMEGATQGDDDPLDVCVVSSHAINHPGILLDARVVGGIPMLDSDSADDKIVAVLSGDGIWGEVTDIAGLPAAIIDQLVHYFSTYKKLKKPEGGVSVGPVYGRAHAEAVVTASIEDYAGRYGAASFR